MFTRHLDEPAVYQAQSFVIAGCSSAQTAGVFPLKHLRFTYFPHYTILGTAWWKPFFPGSSLTEDDVGKGLESASNTEGKTTAAEKDTVL